MVTHLAFEQAHEALLARGPGRMIPDLSRITQMASLMGDAQLAYPTVHVTGTNGKGSIVRMIGALCSAAGLSAGTYTSPHLQTVRERLSVAGRPIGPSRFVELYDELAPLADMVDAGLEDNRDHVTYFEFLTAMAYSWFADVPVDVGVFEVGMGGRWDATNLVRGDVAVLGPIDVDHSELGGTAVEVAREKVGIIKPSSTVITAEQSPDVMDVIDAAVSDAGATLIELGEQIEVMDRSVAVGGQLLTFRVGERTIDDVLLPLFGGHQAENAALALAAFAALTGDAFDQMEDDVVRHGLGAVEVPGRLEIVRREPSVILDGAHNPHGAAASATAIDDSFGFTDLVLVAACLDDKDIDGILQPFKDLASHVVVTRAPHGRSASVERMYEAALAVWGDSGVVVEKAVELSSALTLAESVAAEGDGIVVVGSLITVGAARDRYLPISDDAEDEIVFEPEDEPEPVDEVEADEVAALLADDDAFQDALDELFDDEE